MSAGTGTDVGTGTAVDRRPPGASSTLSRSATTEALPLPRAEAGFPDRMREIQFGFIDDPRKAALAADRLVEDLVRALTKDLARRRQALERLTAEDGEAAPATEQLRMSVRGSRDLVDDLTAARRAAGI